MTVVVSCVHTHSWEEEVVT